MVTLPTYTTVSIAMHIMWTLLSYLFLIGVISRAMFGERVEFLATSSSGTPASTPATARGSKHKPNRITGPMGWTSSTASPPDGSPIIAPFPTPPVSFLSQI